jgi:hypothetical protein
VHIPDRSRMALCLELERLINLRLAPLIALKQAFGDF